MLTQRCGLAQLCPNVWNRPPQIVIDGLGRSHSGKRGRRLLIGRELDPRTEVGDVDAEVVLSCWASSPLDEYDVVEVEFGASHRRDGRCRCPALVPYLGLGPSLSLLVRKRSATRSSEGRTSMSEMIASGDTSAMPSSG